MSDKVLKKPEIQIKDLSFRYWEKSSMGPYVLRHVDFEAAGNTTVGIVGANGAGKSTLLRIMTGLLENYEGSVKINGIDVVRENLRAVREKTGYIFQDSDSQLFMNTVYEEAVFGPRNQGLTEEQAGERAVKALEAVGIGHLKEQKIYRLSGGQKKLTAIAAVLAMGSEVFLMDEPSVALDPANRENLIRVVKGLAGIKIIASHDLDFIYDTCEYTLLLSAGQVAAQGSTENILKNRKLLEENGLRMPLSFRFLPQI